MKTEDTKTHSPEKRIKKIKVRKTRKEHLVWKKVKRKINFVKGSSFKKSTYKVQNSVFKKKFEFGRKKPISKLFGFRVCAF